MSAQPVESRRVGPVPVQIEVVCTPPSHLPAGIEAWDRRAVNEWLARTFSSALDAGWTFQIAVRGTD